MPSVNWTVHVEELGPVRQADINVRPLTLLVGENSTGKSYLATLLWGLAQINSLPLTWQDLNKDDSKLIRDIIKKSDGALTFSQENIDKIISIANKRLLFVKNRFIASIFNNTKITAGTISVQSHNTHRSAILPLANQSELSIFLHALDSIIGHGSLFAEATYLPAARTGFLLTYPYIVRSGIAAIGMGISQQPITLTRPTIEFLQYLSTGTTDNSRFIEEAQALEEALGGSIIQQSQAGFHHYQYRMKGAELGLPMSVVSTMVSELAPIITILKGSRTLPFLVIEEPEAHLHPKIQRILAVVIARLIRKGVCITLTTHSDIFCHQLNNLIKLGSLPEAKRRVLQKKLKLKPTDYLLPEEVSGYGLTLSKDRTHSLVEALRMNPYGLVMPTFNQEIDQLEAQSDALDKAIEATQ